MREARRFAEDVKSLPLHLQLLRETFGRGRMAPVLLKELRERFAAEGVPADAFEAAVIQLLQREYVVRKGSTQDADTLSIRPEIQDLAESLYRSTHLSMDLLVAATLYELTHEMEWEFASFSELRAKLQIPLRVLMKALDVLFDQGMIRATPEPVYSARENALVTGLVVAGEAVSFVRFVYERTMVSLPKSQSPSSQASA